MKLNRESLFRDLRMCVFGLYFCVEVVAVDYFLNFLPSEEFSSGEEKLWDHVAYE